jgi:FkbM family methyltransferase
MRAWGRVTSAVRGGLWLIRAGGLRGRLHELQEQASTWRRLEGQLARIDGRIAEVATRATEAALKADGIERHLRSRAEVRGHRMFLDPTDGIVSPTLLQDGVFEPTETELLEREIGPGDVVLDVGANIGYYTLLFARRVGPQGRVFAFEPDPANFQLLRRNVRANGYRNVTLVPAAVSDRTAPTRLYLCRENKGDHRLYDSRDDRPSIEVPATTLDDYFAAYDGPIDVIKLDIQGSEGRALRGMSGLLRRHPGLKLTTEFWPIGLERAGTDPRGYLEDLIRWGFRLHEIDERREALGPADAAGLLATYTAANQDFTNLFCVRPGAAPTAAVPGPGGGP